VALHPNRSQYIDQYRDATMDPLRDGSSSEGTSKPEKIARSNTSVRTAGT
jgi:hypothetical protein